MCLRYFKVIEVGHTVRLIDQMIKNIIDKYNPTHSYSLIVINYIFAERVNFYWVKIWIYPRAHLGVPLIHSQVFYPVSCRPQTIRTRRMQCKEAARASHVLEGDRLEIPCRPSC